MKTVIKYVSVIVFHTLLGSAPAAGLDPLAWRFEQQVVVSVPGLTKLDLPVETIAVPSPAWRMCGCFLPGVWKLRWSSGPARRNHPVASW